MTYIAKPKLHHPKLPTNALGYTHRDYEGSVSTLVRRLRPQFDQRRDHPGVLRVGLAAAPHRQIVGDRLFVEDADLFPRPVARLQQRARPHAVAY